jgi:hypothetical protein
LPDFDSLAKKKATPEQHLIANSVLNAMTAVVSGALAIALYVSYLGKDDTPILIFVTAGFLTAIFFWQIQVIWRNVLLKRSMPGFRNNKGEAPPAVLAAPRGSRILGEGDPDEYIVPSVVEGTTRRLAEKVRRRSP